MGVRSVMHGDARGDGSPTGVGPRWLFGVVVLALGTAATGMVGAQVGAQAQVVTDGTVGPAVTLDGPDYAIGADLGTRAGSNLFHSFERFSVHSGQSATFTGPESVTRVIGRVTGGEASTIDGTLRVGIPSADLYLLNPSGVVMGPNARLDMTGSLHVSTADRLEFEDGAVFPADPAAAATLTVAAPAAFGFLESNPAEVRSDGAHLTMQPGETITLSGGAVTLNDTLIEAVSGTIGVTATGGPGQVAVDATAPLPPGPKPVGAVRMTASSQYATFLEVATSPSGTDPGGNIVVRGGEVVLDGAGLSSNSLTAAPGGSVRIDATGDVSLRNGAAAASLATASGGAGLVEIRTPGTVEIRDANSFATTLTQGSGPGGQLVVESGALRVADGGRLSAGAHESGAGGSLIVRTGALQVTGGGTISAAASGGGAGGTMDIAVTGPVLVSGFGSSVFSSTFGDGNGGALHLSGRDVTIADQASVGSLAASTGATGPVSVTASGTFTLERGGVLSGSTADGSGNVVQVRAGALHLREGGGIDLTSRGAGDAGTLTITVDGPMTMDALGTLIVSDSLGRGRGGNIVVNAGNLTMTDGAIIKSFARDVGAAGDITVQTADDITMIGSGDLAAPLIASDSVVGASGPGGTVTLRARNVDLQRLAFVSTEASGTGAGGQVDIAARDTFYAGADVFVSANTLDTAPAGTVTVSADRIVLDPASIIATATWGTGLGGSIALTAGTSVDITGGAVTADSFGNGDAGSVLVAAPVVNFTEAGALFANTSGAGRGGTITIQTDRMSVRNGQISSGASASGDAGTVSIVAAESLDLDGATTFVTAETAASGAGGTVQIEAGRLTMTDGASVGTEAFGTGRAGNVIITVQGPVTVAGTGELIGVPVNSVISSQTLGEGAAGRVAITAENLTLRDGGTLSSASFGAGAGGNVVIVVADDVIVSSTSGFGTPSLINALSSETAPAGNISIRADSLHVLDGGTVATVASEAAGGRVILDLRDALHVARGRVTTSVASGFGGGGDVTITNPTAVVLNGGRIVANAVGGDGGNITIVTDLFLADPRSVVEASSQLGIDGEITIDAPDVDVSSAVALPSSLAGAGTIRRDVCGTSGPGAAAGSSLVVLGRGALPPDTGGPLPGLLTTPGRGAGPAPWGIDCDGTEADG